MAFQKGPLLFTFFLVISANILYEYLTDNARAKFRLSFSHLYVLGMKGERKSRSAEKAKIENRAILSVLQRERKFKQVDVKKYAQGRVSDEGNKIVETRRRGKNKPQHKPEKGRIMEKQPSRGGIIKMHDISFREVRRSGDSDDITENEGKQNENWINSQRGGCRGNTKNCINKKVENFVKLMKDIDTIEKEKEKRKGNVDMRGEENVYDDEHHTVVVYDGVDEKKDLYNKYKMDKDDEMHTTVIQGTEYLGVGYDFIFGNPIGDPFLKVDPGYRDTIIKLTYPKSDVDYPDSYVNINPNGSYVRNEISCNRSENESEISSMSEYTKELSVDASIGASYGLFGSFSASTGYKSVSNTISKKKFRMFMLKSYCFKYMASLSQYSQWKLSDQFVRAISLLPSYFNSLEHDGTYCTPEQLRDDRKTDKCGSSVQSWMYFFKNFGTHVSTLIHLGGKITQQVKISKNEYKSLSEKGLSVSVNASVGFGLFKAKASTSTDSNESSNENSSNSSMEKETVIIGGTTIYDPNDPKNFEKWAKSIKNNPMPIKGEYEPLSRILPNRLSKVYEEALNFYVAINVPINIGQISNDEMKQYNIKDQLMRSNIIYGSGSGLVVLECEEKQNFILGFSLSIPNDLTTLNDFYMNTCDEDSDKCYSKMSDNTYSYLFAMCNEEMIPFLEQKVKSGTGLLTLECSEKNQVILFGFGISILNSNDPISIAIYPCKYGKGSCSMQGSTDQSAVGLWIVCGHEESKNSKFSVNVRKLAQDNVSGKKKKPIEICPEKVLFNLIFEFTGTPVNKRQGACFSVNELCPKDFHVCSDKKGLKSFNYYSVSVY
ncbi:perforin-like protein 3, putative [Plasmodium ovale]|uniref:MAC/Perforin domain containing protein n=2 Tax=Plasmodium ovale TaxID=36330 RepID=A0A1A8W2X9_PLAOA|nr:MAC/Perforin domain containing protein [Plasmodium ovale curtisi]SBS90963.1 MAC/Perforin domain containing protein [Plasmodium ovale curtisi]SCQ16220.1 perforin-like protein 3, putative [Plasmodium ovale]